jgi:transcriptional regulator with XRE-family HTH domain
MPTFYEEFGRRVARRRAIMRLRQHEVARAIGWQRSHVSALEHGHVTMMRLDQVAALAQVLQTSSDYLLQLVAVDPGPVPDTACLAVATYVEAESHHGPHSRPRKEISQ